MSGAEKESTLDLETRRMQLVDKVRQRLSEDPNTQVSYRVGEPERKSLRWGIKNESNRIQSNVTLDEHDSLTVQHISFDGHRSGANSHARFQDYRYFSDFRGDLARGENDLSGEEALAKIEREIDRLLPAPANQPQDL